MQLHLLPDAVSELFVQASRTGCITLADRYGLMAAVLDESLCDEHRNAIDRLLRAVCKGRIMVVEEISAVV